MFRRNRSLDWKLRRGHLRMGSGEREIEKAAALDRAIEFEDACLNLCTGDACVGPTVDSGFLLKGPTMMVTKEQWLRLDAAAKNLRFADDEFRAACRNIGMVDQGEEAAPAPGPAPSDPPPGTAKVAANSTNGRRSRVEPNAKSHTSGKTYYHSGIRIQCTSCGEFVDGTREKEGKWFPYRHPDPKTGEKCGGTDLPGHRIDTNPGPNPGG